MVKVVDTTVGHLVEFRKHIRPEDLEEIQAATGGIPFDDTPLNELKDCLTLISEKTGDVLGIGGGERYSHGVYRAWLVTTTKIETRKIEFARFSKRYLQSLLKICDVIECVAYVKNRLHLDYIEWLGGRWMTEGYGFRRYRFENRKEGV